MSYQNDQSYGQMRTQKIPPATSPKPYTQTAQGFRPGLQTYRPVNVDHYSIESGAYPPPPPDVVHKGYTYGHDDDFPPPPPPAPPQACGEKDGHTYGNIYSGEAHFMRAEDYRPHDYSPAPTRSKTGPNDSGPGIYPFTYPKESSYANIQINIAPPTPTSKEFGYSDNRYEQIATRGGVGSSTSDSYHVGHSHVIRPSSGERPQPGPMVPPTNKIPHSNLAPVVSTQSKLEKEAEVDALTDLLVKNMTSAAEDKDYLGMCGRCGNVVSGSMNACSALDNVYHIGCFTCVGCSSPLQGKSFFAMESKPYCESCYINTLERCSVCSKPITDRLLRATGKPYHPDCFTCVVCGKSLDGIPFTVDATNQIHCIEDFHKKFAPRCCVCQYPIMPEPGQDETIRIVALDKSFHVACYRCEDCKCQLSSEAEGHGCYPLDDHILCKNCNAKRIQALTTKMSTEL